MKTIIQNMSLATLQHVLLVVRSAKLRGMGIDDVESEVESRVNEHLAGMQIFSAPREKIIPCPAPGCQGFLVFWPIISRLAEARVIGCRTCQYSRIDDLVGDQSLKKTE